MARSGYVRIDVYMQKKRRDNSSIPRNYAEPQSIVEKFPFWTVATDICSSVAHLNWPTAK